MNELSNKSKNKSDEKPIVIRNTTDLQRLKLEKLMKNPDKPVVIPERPKGRSMPTVPDFVRNVMGSSAGAGSGEFHVYRHLRRKEYARQKFIQEKSEKEKLNDAYHDKLENNRKIAEGKTAKKREKRLKRKLRAKQNAKKPKIEQKTDSSEEESSEQSETENSPEAAETEPNTDVKNENDSNETTNKTENISQEIIKKNNDEQNENESNETTNKTENTSQEINKENNDEQNETSPNDDSEEICKNK